MNSLFSKAIFALVIMTNLSSFAQTVNTSSKAKGLRSTKASQSASMGGVATGGGDLCEDRIKNIRDDLKSWILKGGAKTLQLPTGVSAGQYSDDMLEQMSVAKIRCVVNGDAGYPVTVEGAPKVCRFDRSSSLSLITCDLKKFEGMSQEDQYTLVHHEYAGLADIERPNGSESDYRVSNQISQNLENMMVKRMVVKSTVGFQEIPKDRLDSYFAAASESVNKSIVKAPKFSFCITDTSIIYNEQCSNYPHKLYEKMEFIKVYHKKQTGQIRKVGNVTEIVFIVEFLGHQKSAVHFVYDGQALRSVTAKSYDWVFPQAQDISNPPTQKEFVLKRWTTWTRQK